jgi:hypothetical protein
MKAQGKRTPNEEVKQSVDGIFKTQKVCEILLSSPFLTLHLAASMDHLTQMSWWYGCEGVA